MIASRALAAGIALLATRVALHGQGLSPNDAREGARFARVASAVSNAGFRNPVVVGHGTGQGDALFTLLATRRDTGVLVAVLDPGSATARPVLLEHAHTPADLGVRGVQFTRFLGTRDLYDVEINHQPFTLETSHTFSTHHILRLQGDALVLVCDLDGGSSSSYSKGIGSNTTTRDVTIARLPGAAVVFSVRVTAKTVQRRGGEVATATDSSENVKWYEIPPVGTCRETRTPGL